MLAVKRQCFSPPSFIELLFVVERKFFLWCWFHDFFESSGRQCEGRGREGSDVVGGRRKRRNSCLAGHTIPSSGHRNNPHPLEEKERKRKKISTMSFRLTNLLLYVGTRKRWVRGILTASQLLFNLVWVELYFFFRTDSVSHKYRAGARFHCSVFECSVLLQLESVPDRPPSFAIMRGEERGERRRRMIQLLQKSSFFLTNLRAETDSFFLFRMHDVFNSRR